MLQKNARFWTWHKGAYVKLTVKIGSELRHWEGGPTDEGWSRYSCRWFLEDGLLKREWFSEGCDCDGYLSRGGEQSCTLDKLDAWKPEFYDCLKQRGSAFRPVDVERTPDWQDEGDHYYDGQAAAAGY